MYTPDRDYVDLRPVVVLMQSALRRLTQDTA
jgi:hypothetical protein